MTDREILEEVAAEIDGTVRQYSGRSMYGKECMGIVCDDSIACIEAAASRGLTGAVRDNMGRQYIVYWPKIKV